MLVSRSLVGMDRRAVRLILIGASPAEKSGAPAARRPYHQNAGASSVAGRDGSPSRPTSLDGRLGKTSAIAHRKQWAGRTFGREGNRSEAERASLPSRVGVIRFPRSLIFLDDTSGCLKCGIWECRAPLDFSLCSLSPFRSEPQPMPGRSQQPVEPFHRTREIGTDRPYPGQKDFLILSTT